LENIPRTNKSGNSQRLLQQAHKRSEEANGVSARSVEKIKQNTINTIDAGDPSLSFETPYKHRF
jgi:hypothetical protein